MEDKRNLAMENLHRLHNRLMAEMRSGRTTDFLLGATVEDAPPWLLKRLAEIERYKLGVSHDQT